MCSLKLPNIHIQLCTIHNISWSMHILMGMSWHCTPQDHYTSSTGPPIKQIYCNLKSLLPAIANNRSNGIAITTYADFSSLFKRGAHQLSLACGSAKSHGMDL